MAATHQGRGLGRRLADHAVARATEDGRAFVWLGVWEDNTKGIAVYGRLAFRAFGEDTFLVGSDPQRDVLMRPRQPARPAPPSLERASPRPTPAGGRVRPPGEPDRLGGRPTLVAERTPGASRRAAVLEVWSRSLCGPWSASVGDR